MTLLFPAAEPITLPVRGTAAQYPIRRIFCVGRNYAAHAAEMGATADRDAPFYFTKSALSAAASGQTLPYPPGTANYHYEMELVVAIGAPAFRVSAADAPAAIFGYACGLDMTRRDLQLAARARERPWDTGKDVENSAIFAPLTPVADLPPLGPQRIALTVNAEVRQDARISDLIHPVPAVIADLSRLYHLGPGDLIMTGTPAGVGPVVPGDVIRGTIDGLDPVTLTIGETE